MFCGFIFVTFCFIIESSSEFVKLKYPYSPSNEINFRILDREALSVNTTTSIAPSSTTPKTTLKKVAAAEPFVQAVSTPELPNPSTTVESFIIADNKTNITLPETLSQTDVKVEKLAVRQVINTAVTFRPIGVFSTTPMTNQLNCTYYSPNGTWTEWVVSEACTAGCGACGRQTRTRQCMSYNVTTGNGCPCEGVYKQLVPCNINVCQYPWPSCCPPYNLIYVNNLFACGPQSIDTINTFVSQSNGSYNATTGVGK